MQIEQRAEWHLTAAEDAAIADLLARCFDTDFGGRSYFHHRHHLRLLAREAGHLVGHMALTLRRIRLGGATFEVACLGEVATDSGHRGKGIAARLLQAAIAEAKHSPARHFLLFGTARLYQAAGFRRVRNTMTFLAIEDARSSAVLTEPAEELMVLPLRSDPWDDAAPLDLLGPKF